MRSGFFNSNITGNDEQGQPIFDRAEDAAFFAKYFSQFVGNGVFAEPGTGLMVQAKDGMDITVKAGTCFIGGYMGWLENDQQMTLAAASTVYDRIDRVVARYDALQRSVELYVVQGQGSAAPVAPALVRDGDTYELALADVYVTRNATMLRQADITDQRLNESVCGLVASPVEHLETEEVTAQLTDAFDQWFRRMKDQLTEDAAGHLQAQVEALSAETKAHAADVGNPHQVTAEQIGAAKKADMDTQLAGKANRRIPDMISITGILDSAYEPYLNYLSAYSINEFGQVSIWGTVRKKSGPFTDSPVIANLPAELRPQGDVQFPIMLYIAYTGENDNMYSTTGAVGTDGKIRIFTPSNEIYNVAAFYVVYNKVS